MRKFFFIICLIFVFLGCEHEDVFQFKPPLKLVSWAEYLDSIPASGSITINKKSVFANARSNFMLLGSDTLYSFSFRFPKDDKFSIFSFSLKSNNLNKVITSANLIESSFLLTNFFSYNSSSIKYDLINFVVKHNSGDDFKLNGNFKIIATNIKGGIDTVVFDVSNLIVQKSFFRLYKNSQLVPLDLSLFNVDLKGGSEYSPNPTLDFDVGFMQKMIVSIPMEYGINEYSGSNLNNMLYFKNKGKFWLSDKSGFLKINKFYYGDIIDFKYSTKFKDTSSGNDYIFDSIVVNYSRITL